MGAFDDVNAQLALAEAIQAQACETQRDFVSCIHAGHWEEAEEARFRTLVLIEASMDAFVAAARLAHKQMFG